MVSKMGLLVFGPLAFLCLVFGIGLLYSSFAVALESGDWGGGFGMGIGAGAALTIFGYFIAKGIMTGSIENYGK